MTTLRGPHFQTIGRLFEKGKLRLLPEEALFLVERGALALKMPSFSGEVNEFRTASFQECYNELLDTTAKNWFGSFGFGELSFEKYLVYSHLKRLGYIVFRTPDSVRNSVCPSRQYKYLSVERLFGWVGNLFSGSSGSQKSTKGLIDIHNFQNENNALSSLRIIPYSKYGSGFKSSSNEESKKWLPDFDVYKSDQNFRKMSLGTPDFRVVVTSSEQNFPGAIGTNHMIQTCQSSIILDEDYDHRGSKKKNIHRVFFGKEQTLKLYSNESSQDPKKTKSILKRQRTDEEIAPETPKQMRKRLKREKRERVPEQNEINQVSKNVALTLNTRDFQPKLKVAIVDHGGNVSFSGIEEVKYLSKKEI
ncbi:tRNA-splicing endonuclease subunit sen54 [Nowakowskiella sp. JEL0078]|nr:tRNA-splicing endonuclease subunit sen54 [Nowakowskiella sp. JEL0078]